MTSSTVINPQWPQALASADSTINCAPALATHARNLGLERLVELPDLFEIAAMIADIPAALASGTPLFGSPDRQLIYQDRRAIVLLAGQMSATSTCVHAATPGTPLVHVLDRRHLCCGETVCLGQMWRRPESDLCGLCAEETPTMLIGASWSKWLQIGPICSICWDRMEGNSAPPPSQKAEIAFTNRFKR